MYSRILVPLDGSPFAEAILPHVKMIAGGFGSELILLYVIPTAVPEFALPPPPLGKERLQDKNQRKKIARYLKDMCAKLEAENLRANYLLSQGGVAETILEVAELMETELIAMTTRGRSEAKMLLLGSITYHVVRHSPLPVLLIRANE